MNGNRTGAFIGAGVALGIALGVMMDNIGSGLAIGIALGAGMGPATSLISHSEVLDNRSVSCETGPGEQGNDQSSKTS